MHQMTFHRAFSTHGQLIYDHYNLVEIKRQESILCNPGHDNSLQPDIEMISARAKDKKAEFLFQNIDRLSEIFIADELTEDDLYHCACTIRHKVRESKMVMQQIENNTAEETKPVDFPNAVDDGVPDSSDAHQNQMMHFFSDPNGAAGFTGLIFELLQRSYKNESTGISQ
jgi:type I restriction enzyme, R subunit